MHPSSFPPATLSRPAGPGEPIGRVFSAWPTLRGEVFTRLYGEFLQALDRGSLLEFGCLYGLHLDGVGRALGPRYTGTDLGHAVEFASRINPALRFVKSRLRGWELAEIAGRLPDAGLLVVHTRFEVTEDAEDLLAAVLGLGRRGWKILAFIDPVLPRAPEDLTAHYRRRWSVDAFTAWVAAGGGQAQMLGYTQGDYRAVSGTSYCFLLTPAEDPAEEELVEQLAELLPVKVGQRQAPPAEAGEAGAAADDPGLPDPNDILMNLSIPAYLSGRYVENPASLLPERERLLADEAVMARIAEAKRRREPFSLVRLGNGEARVAGYPDFTSPIWLSRSFRNWFGSRAVEGENALIRAHMLAAVVASDLVGIPSGEGSGGDAHWGFARVMLRVYSCMPADGALCRHAFHLTAMKNRFFEDLVRNEPSVSVISPHDLRAPLADGLGVGDVAWYGVPGQAKFFAREGQRPHYPEVFQDIRERLRVRRPGEIFLVGAGPLGKVYCHWVKAAGGIALDVGSVLDVWAGFATRSGFDRLLGDYRMAPREA